MKRVSLQFDKLSENTVNNTSIRVYRVWLNDEPVDQFEVFYNKENEWVAWLGDILTGNKRFRWRKAFAKRLNKLERV